MKHVKKTTLTELHKTAISKIILLFISLGSFINLTSCASFIDRVHHQITDEENKNASLNNLNNSNMSANGFKTKSKDKFIIKDPISYSISGEENQDQLNTGPLPLKRRMSTQDFIDNDDSGSLWTKYDDSSSFFTSSNFRKVGEIISINVMESLKNTISRELRKRYPASHIFKTVTNDGTSTEVTPSAAATVGKNDDPTKKADEKEDTEVAEIIYDKISARIAEVVDDEHVMIKGRKEVYFRNQKRLIEVQALAKKVDIDSNSLIKSDSFVEAKVKILKTSPL